MTKVYRSAVIDAPADKVWKLVRDFNGLPKWHPAIATSEIEGGLPADRVGCVRRFTLQGATAACCGSNCCRCRTTRAL